MTDEDVLDLINQAVAVVVRRVQQSVVLPQFLFGTVVDVNVTGPSIHEVQLDGDEDESVPVMDVSGQTVLVGDRVAVVHAPPHQLWLVGKYPG